MGKLMRGREEGVNPTMNVAIHMYVGGGRLDRGCYCVMSCVVSVY